MNQILDVRVRSRTWNRLQAGDVANLDGSGSVFAVDAVTKELARRCEEIDIHPTATLWGEGAPLTSKAVANAELDAVAAYDSLTEGLKKLRVEASSRALRMPVHDLTVEFTDDVVWLAFTLPKGGFATAVLREIVNV